MGATGWQTKAEIRCIGSCLTSDTDTIFTSTGTLSTICDHNGWQSLVRDSMVGSPMASSVSTQVWVNIFLQAQQSLISNVMPPPPCQKCGGPCEHRVFFTRPPPLMTFEDVAQSLPSLLGSPTLELPTASGQVQYQLRGIIYEGGFHFSARMLEPNGLVWQYDGQVNGGHPAIDLIASDLNFTTPSSHYQALTTLDHRRAHLLVYVQV